MCAVQEEVSIAKDEWELGHLKAIKEQDERRAEIDEDDMLYLESSPSKSSSAGKHGRSKPKFYSYGGWEFASFDEDVISSFLDDDGSQNIADDTSAEPAVVNRRVATVQRARDRKRKASVAKTKPSALKKTDSPGTVAGRKLWAKKRRAELRNRDGSTEKGESSRKRLKVTPNVAKIQKLPKKVIRSVKEKADHVAVGSVTLDGKNVRHNVRARFASPDVSKVPRLQAVQQFSRPMTIVQHRPLVRPIRSSEIGIRPRMVRVPVRTGARTIAEIGAQSPPQPTPILEKLGATVLASPSSANQPSRLTQIVSSISALQSTVLGNASSSPGAVQYVFTTNARPAIQPVGQTPLVIGTSVSPPISVGGNLRSNVIYHVPPAAGHQQLPLQTAVQSVTTVKSSQPPRLVLPSSVTSASSTKQSFVLTAPGGDRQSFVLLPTSNRQSYILAPAASASQPATVVSSTASATTPGVVRPASFTIQLTPPRMPRTSQQPIQPAPVQRTIQLAPSLPRPAVNTQPILEKFALQLNSTRPAVAATYEVVAHSGELIAAASPTKVPLQQIVYPAVSPPPSQIVRLPGSTGTSSVQLVVGAASVAKPAVQTITMPQFVIRQPRQVAPASSVIAAAAPAMMPLRSQLSAPRIVSGTNLVQVPNSQLSTVIIVDSSPVSRQS